ncbi:helix-turn-helix domain-containing protein [Fischerella sp. PCC 9605]|uniref:helix-turn-helix domain-containing protein n=1 Tax=Fischerella sp. PCC 9605 TaxID=1173024 RepID=UPI00047BBD93|nr:helix-turn-helix transcriptional regulator [Fischerella sp. PCC 9605]
MIRWRLRELMARYKVGTSDLAKEVGVSGNSISNLKAADEMPRIDGHRLNDLCHGLSKLTGRKITPWDFIEYIPDEEVNEDD